MITIKEQVEDQIIVDYRWQSQFARQLFLALGDRTRMAICAMSGKLARHFATFAGVPYRDPIHLQQWEQIWETERRLSDEREPSPGSPLGNIGGLRVAAIVQAVIDCFVGDAQDKLHTAINIAHDQCIASALSDLDLLITEHSLVANRCRIPAAPNCKIQSAGGGRRSESQPDR